MMLTWDEAFAELTSGAGPYRSYGPCSARGLLHAAKVGGAVTDEYPRNADGSRPVVRICALDDAGTRFTIRDMTVVPAHSPARRNARDPPDVRTNRRPHDLARLRDTAYPHR